MAKTLDDALDEFERWSEPLNDAFDRMTPEERIAFLEDASRRFEEETGIDLPVVEAPPPDVVFRHSLEGALEQIRSLQRCMRVALSKLSPKAKAAFLQGPLKRFEKRTGIKLNLRPASSRTAARAS